MSQITYDGTKQDRILVLTDVAFYLISEKKIHSKMMVNLLTYYIRSGDAGTQEVILCFKNQAGSGSFIDVRL